MRFRMAWIVTWVLSCCVSLANVAQAQVTVPVVQDLGPEEDEMEVRGAPPIKTTPAVVGEPGTPNLDAGPTSLDVDPNLLANAQLMNQLIDQATKQTIRQQKYAAAAGITGGVILLGLGAWRLLEDPPRNDFTRGLGVMFMTLGAADLTTGIFAASRVPHEKRRLKRWEGMKADGITEYELARIEGEFQSSAETRQGERLLVRWNGLAHALAGILTIGISAGASSNDSNDDKVTYIVGGVFTVTGMAAFGLSFRPTPSERAWKVYTQKRLPMANSQLSFRLAPAVSRRSAGVGLSGTF